jgi:hypothetical protein
LPSALAFGAPGIYRVPVQTARVLRGVRLDVCAFVGVAERGPSRVPLFDETWRDDRPWVEPSRPRRRSVAVAVDSWDGFRRLYGDGGPGHLPRSVEAFFRQGGRRAYVVRVVHRYGQPADGHFDPVEAQQSGDAQRDDAGVAWGPVAGVRTSGGADVALAARDEGAWGDRLRAAMRFTATPLGFVAATPATLDLAYGTPLAAGALLRLTLPGGVRVLRFATHVAEAWDAASGARRLVAALESPVADLPQGVEVVEGVLDVDDGDGRHETHAGLGLAFGHPRWAALVLCRESALVWPHHAWAEDALVPLDAELSQPLTDPALAGTEADPYRFTGGLDRYPELVSDDFFDARYVRGDEEPRDGIHALADVAEVALVATPDLYHPAPAVESQAILTPPSLAGPEFAECVAFVAAGPQAPPAPGLDGLLLDPRIPADLETIAALQQRAVDFAEERRRFIVLLDVPPGLRPRRILDWRARFDSAFAAAYHPWLRVGDGDPRTPLPPAGVAAGLIAKRELLFGLSHGPANELAVDVVGQDEPVPAALHDTLHPLGVNVFQSERDGVRLTGARTLSRDPAWRQLSVRRLMTHLVLVLEREMQWLVFEPNTPELRAQVRQLLRAFLRRLFAAGAFQGKSEEEAFFVRCDDELNPPRLVDLGQLVCEVGVAPSEPMEFLVLRIARDHDGGLTVEAP